MKPAAIVGIVLIILGALALTYRSFSFTDRETHDLGPIEVVTKETKTVPVAPILGRIAIVGGLVLVLTSRRTRA